MWLETQGTRAWFPSWGLERNDLNLNGGRHSITRSRMFGPSRTFGFTARIGRCGRWCLAGRGQSRLGDRHAVLRASQVNPVGSTVLPRFDVSWVDPMAISEMEPVVMRQGCDVNSPPVSQAFHYLGEAE